MDTLRRDAAPLSERVWKEIDRAVGQAARHVLTVPDAGRQGHGLPARGRAPGRGAVCALDP